MGCAASKLDNEETVRRCKERRRFMRDAVYARHHLAAAHSDYCQSLRLTGSALLAFAAGEPLAVSGDSPAVFLNTKNSHCSPPPSPPSAPPPATAKTSKLPNIIPSFTVEAHRRKPPPKLPHILSESSLCSSPISQYSNSFFPTAASETSSVWNWENIQPPPSPPCSEYFRQRSQPQNHNPENPISETPDSDSEPETSYNLFHSKPNLQNRNTENNTNIDSRNPHQRFGSERSEYDFIPETEREEVHCSEWEDCYVSTSSSEREEVTAGLGPSARAKSVAGGDVPATKEEKDAGEKAMEEKVKLRHQDLKGIVEAIKENFEKAAVAGDELSEMLEISNAQLDKSFSQLKSKLLVS